MVGGWNGNKRMYSGVRDQDIFLYPVLGPWGKTFPTTGDEIFFESFRTLTYVGSVQRETPQ